MSKGKLQKFAEIAEFKNVIQPDIKMHVQENFKLKGKWAKEYFKNSNPIVLELGCGKGEYTIGLAKKNPNKNFIGLDIKGARIWRGAKTAIEKNLSNVAFIRTRIDLILSFFAKNEISEIWITFPDPQPKKQNKRLTSAKFINLYRQILTQDATIHLKTDSKLMHYYTLELLKANNIKPDNSSNNIYSGLLIDEDLAIKTFYEKQFIEQGKTITYLNFKPKNKVFNEIDKYTKIDVPEKD